MIQKLPLEQIEIFAGTQARHHTDNEVVTEYQERMKEGDVFPPIVVFHDGEHYFLADGFHRVLASENCMFLDIDADVREGSLSDALWYALGCNKNHGLRMSGDDVRNAIRLALEKFPEKSQVEISQQIGCSQQYVSKVKADVTTSCNVSLPAVRTDTLGREQPTRKQRKADPLSLPAPDEKPKRHKSLPPCIGLQYASIAIMNLEQIKDDDTEFDEAFRQVEEYIVRRRAQS